MLSSTIRQLLVALSSQLAAVSVGGSISYPNVLIHQLKSDDRMVLDLDTTSWIGSIHGLAGIPSILMPAFMQWKGRKLAFLVSCFFVAAGWLLAYTGTSITAILISECLHGLGSHSVLIVSSCSMSELLGPKYRNSLMASYFLLQCLGLSAVIILGQYIHWKIISLIMLVPVVLSFLNVLLIWPESPSWLAIKGRYDECVKNFKWLRGDDKEANNELTELLSVQKETKVKESLCKRLTRRDFYVPAILMFVLLNTMYWSGLEVMFIYTQDILLGKTTDDTIAVSHGIIALNVCMFVSYNICVILLRRFNNRLVLFISLFGTIACSLFCCVVTYLQSSGVLGKSLLCMYGMIGYVIACAMGVPSIVFNTASELMPVKHRDIGGALYIVYTGILHLTALKAAPYMLLYMDLWGTFLIYALNATISLIIIWVYVPETKNRTLQELEDYFTYGKFIKRLNDDSNEPIVKSNCTEY